MKLPDEQKKLRGYILGIGDEDRSAIEERLMTDDDYFQKLAMIEEDLIQDYVDGNLDAAESAKFEKRFLLSDENRQKVKFARALRKYVNETDYSPEPHSKPGFFDSLKAFFSSPVPATLAVLIVLGIAGFFLWNRFSSSNNSEVLLALNKAYDTERPIESRITDLNYAPTRNTRGADDSDKTDKIQRDLAGRLALKAASENPTAENFHTLGRVYLTEKEFDKAIEQFEKAIKLAPNNAKIHNDLGVALMEKAKTQSENKLEYLGRALKEFERAYELNSELIESLFNKAICFELIPLPNQAKTTWYEYLKFDSVSPWANEARQHLERLDSKSNKELSAAEFEQEFLKFYRQKNDEGMWQLISQNREMIKVKYLPQRLVMNFVNSSTVERKQILEFLRYLGNLEKERIGDFFALDLANFYENLSEDKIVLLKKAQISMKNGYQLCLDDKPSAAIDEFVKAKEFFTQAGNFLESIAISQHFIAYCLYNIDRRKEAIEVFQQVENFCKRRNYRWLQLSTSYWLTGWNSNSLDFHSTRKAKEKYQAGLKVSEEINDQYFIQKYLLTLALRSHKLRQEKEMLFYLQRLFNVSNKPEISFRQKFRNFATSIEMLLSANFEEIAAAVVMEELSLANESKEKFFITTAQIDASVVQMQIGNFPEAEKWLTEAKQTIEGLDEVSQKNDLLANILLKFGNLERKKNNYKHAAKYYDESLKIVETQESPLLLYEVSKSRLIAYQELGNYEEVGNQIPVVIKLAEDYRSEILEEQERNSFFDNEQNVYDIAVEYQISAGNNRKAFDYAEISNSRSLLDWLNKGINKSVEKNEIILKESTTPYTIEEIQNRMPSEVQILQYTVLEKKVLIWAISRENIAVVSSEIESRQLNEKVKEYISLIRSSSSENQLEAKKIGRELYEILITPILPYLDKNKETCLIPNKILFQLPFAALISSDGNFFLIEFSFFYAPSASVFILCTENAMEKQKLVVERLLSIGNPSFDPKEFSDLQDLPASEDEANEISQYYEEKPKILLREEATKKSVQKLFREFEIVHFAGHYIVQQNSPLSSGLVLAKDNDNGVLTSYELAGDSLHNTKMVVLSACQTGVEGYYNGEGLIGLSRIFLASGVPLVISSQWKVDSDATAELMKNFHRYRRQEKLSANSALRRAQIDMLKSEEDGFSSPYYWAAFASFGGFTRF